MPAIFNVRIATDNSGKKPLFLACCTTAGCVARASTWKKALKAMHTAIVEILELKNEYMPRPLVMEVAECPARGDLYFYESVEKTQKHIEPFYLKQKQWREKDNRRQEALENPGKTRLTGTEE
jgi:hypothetical protein